MLAPPTLAIHSLFYYIIAVNLETDRQKRKIGRELFKRLKERSSGKSVSRFFIGGREMLPTEVWTR
jgi:hypothetical protein